MKIKWNLKAFEQVRRMPEVESLLEDIVTDIQLDAGEGYFSDVTRGRTRSRGSVIAGEIEAILDNNEHNTLLRLLADKRGELG